MAINGPRKELPKGLKGLEPLNICLKLEIWPAMGQKEDKLAFLNISSSKKFEATMGKKGFSSSFLFFFFFFFFLQVQH
jgi:hypothetical protein